MERVTETDISWINENTHILYIATKLQMKRKKKHTQQIQEIKIINCESGFFSLSLLSSTFGWFSCFLYYFICYIAIQSDSFNGECLSWHYITRPYCLYAIFIYMRSRSLSPSHFLFFGLLSSLNWLVHSEFCCFFFFNFFVVFCFRLFPPY